MGSCWEFDFLSYISDGFISLCSFYKSFWNSATDLSKGFGDNESLGDWKCDEFLLNNLLSCGVSLLPPIVI